MPPAPSRLPHRTLVDVDRYRGGTGTLEGPRGLGMPTQCQVGLPQEKQSKRLLASFLNGDGDVQRGLGMRQR